MIRQLYPAGKWQHSFHPCVTPVKRVDHLLLPADFGALTSCREAPDVPGPTNYPTRPPERQREIESKLAFIVHTPCNISSVSASIIEMKVYVGN